MIPGHSCTETTDTNLDPDRATKWQQRQAAGGAGKPRSGRPMARLPGVCYR